MLTGRPVKYEPNLLLPWLRPIWQASDYACGRRLVAMLPEWIPAYEAHEKSLSPEVRDKLLAASGRTLDRLLAPYGTVDSGSVEGAPVRLLSFFASMDLLSVSFIRQHYTESKVMPQLRRAQW